MRVARGAKETSGKVLGRSLGRSRIVVTAVVISAGLSVASCAGTSNEDSFSAYVADHWPHWAGGMPDDVPPRPGAPGYRQFIAHGQPDQDQPPPAGANGLAAAPGTPVFQTTPAATAQAARPQTTAPARAPAAPPAPAAVPSADVQAAPEPAADDTSVVHGGLY